MNDAQETFSGHLLLNMANQGRHYPNSTTPPFDQDDASSITEMVPISISGIIGVCILVILAIFFIAALVFCLWIIASSRKHEKAIRRSYPRIDRPVSLITEDCYEQPAGQDIEQVLLQYYYNAEPTSAKVVKCGRVKVEGAASLRLENCRHTDLPKHQKIDHPVAAKRSSQCQNWQFHSIDDSTIDEVVEETEKPLAIGNDNNKNYGLGDELPAK